MRRYVPIFGQSIYDPKQERPDSVPFEETVEALGVLIKGGHALQRCHYWTGSCLLRTPGDLINLVTLRFR